MKKFVLIMCAVGVAGCSPVAEVTGSKRQEITDEVLKEYAGPLGPSSINVTGMWHSNGDPSFSMICGEFEAPEALKGIRDSLRFIDDPDTKVVQVEYHELWVSAGGDMSLIEANRRIFNQLWDNHCAPYAPKWWMPWA